MNQFAPSVDFAVTFGEAADRLAPMLEGIRWSDARPAPSSPAEMLQRYSVPVTLPPCQRPRRQYRTEELLAMADAHGIEIAARADACGYRYGWRSNGAAVAPRFRSSASAALDALRVLSPQTPACALATGFRVVAPWLAYALEQRGEVVRHTEAGVSVWAVCNGDDADPDTCPVLRDVFAYQCLGLREGVA